MKNRRASSRINLLKYSTLTPGQESQEPDMEFNTEQTLKSKVSQKKFERLVNDGVAETIAMKITVNST